MALMSEIDIFTSIDFQPAHLWDFYLIDPPDSITSLSSAAKALEGTMMKFRITSSSLPLSSLEIEATKSGKKHYISRNFEDQFTITIMEDTTFSAFNYFNDWMKKVYDFDRNVWLSKPPTKNGILVYNATVGVPTAIFLYETVKIIGIDNINQDRASQNILTLTIKLTYEKMTYQTPVGDVFNSIKNGAYSLLANI